MTFLSTFQEVLRRLIKLIITFKQIIKIIISKTIIKSKVSNIIIIDKSSYIKIFKFIHTYSRTINIITNKFCYFVINSFSLFFSMIKFNLTILITKMNKATFTTIIQTIKIIIKKFLTIITNFTSFIISNSELITMEHISN